jgi:hypothetical protein
MAQKVFGSKPSEKFFDFSKIILRSFNPDAYNELSSQNLSQAMRYLLLGAGLSAFILLVLIGFNLMPIKHSLSEQFSHLESIDFSVSEPIRFEKLNVAIADTNYTSENLLVTGSEVTRKPLDCMLFKAFCDGSVEKMELTGLGERPIGGIIFTVFIAIIPVILLLFFAFELVKSILLAFILIPIAMLMIRMFKQQLSVRRILLIGMYSSTILLIADPLAVFFNLHYIQFAVFILFYGLCIALVSEDADVRRT